MVRVAYIGNYIGERPDDIALVEDDQGYVAVCAALPAMLGCGHDRHVWVRSRHHWNWLRTFAGISAVADHCSFEEMTARRILAETWRVSIPDWLDDQMVEAERLLEVSVPDGHPAEFVDCILTTLISPFLALAAFDEARLGDTLKALLSAERNGVIDQHPVARRAWEEKCAGWNATAGNEWRRYVIGKLGQAPEALWEELTAWALLSRYPVQALEFVLEPQRAAAVRLIPLDVLKSLELQPQAREKAKEQIQTIFHDIGPQVKTLEGYRNLAKCVSGRLPEELALLTDTAEKALLSLTPGDVRSIEHAFEGCPAVAKAALRQLELLVVPPTPGPVPQTAGGNGCRDWVHWYLEEYLPYRLWQQKSGHWDEGAEAAAVAFSDWYTASYVEVQKRASWGLTHTLAGWRHEIESDDVSIILIVDCLPVGFWRHLEDAMLPSGFHRHQLTYRFAPLPTHTAASKGCLLAGKWEQKTADYSRMLSDRAKADWPGRKAVYVANLDGLKGIVIPECPLVVAVNYLFADKALHGTPEDMGSTHEEELERLFVKLAASLRLFAGLVGTERKLGIYLVTDHGAMMALPEERRSLDSQAAKGLFSDPEHRFAAVDEATAAKVPKNLWGLGYRFKEPFSGKGGLYFIPKGHNTVDAVSARGFIHGGAAPEEVIVPAALFRTVKPPLKPLNVRFLDLRLEGPGHRAVFYVKRLVQVTIEVQNPNAMEAEIGGIELKGTQVEVKGFELASIAGRNVQQVSMSCYFSAQPSDVPVDLELVLAYRMGGQGMTSNVSLQVELRSALKKKTFDLRDLS